MDPTDEPLFSRWEPEMDLEAAEVLGRHLAADALPPAQLEGPESETARLAAFSIAHGILRELEGIYGLEAWDRGSFEWAYLKGALAMWRPGSSFEQVGRELRVRTPRCPLLEKAEADPRVCQLCQLTHGLASRIAAPGEIRGMEAGKLIVAGDPVCEFTFHLRDP